MTDTHHARNRISYCANILLVCGVAAHASIGPAVLFPHPSLPTGHNPLHMEVADLNNDGIQDLIVVNTGSNAVPNSSNLYIYYGNRDTGFDRPVEVETGPDPVGVTPADLNHDGRLDLLVATFGQSKVETLVQQPDGSFGAPVPHSAFAFPTRIRVADLNGDGHIDVVANGSFGQVKNSYINVFFGNGDGSLQPAVNLSGVNPQNDILLNDLDGDTRSDLICVSWQGVFFVYVEQDGTLARGPSLFEDANALHARLADLDGNGYDDLVVATTNPNSIRVFLSESSGVFTESVALPLAHMPLTLACGDTNSDGMTDIVTSIQTVSIESETLIYAGHGDGQFDAARSFHSGDEPVHQLIFDYNMDGLNDVATLFNDDDHLTIASSTSEGWFLLPRPTTDGDFLYIKTIDDFNNDQLEDVITNSDREEQLFLRTALQSGGYAEPVLIDDNIRRGYDSATHDINQDGFVDLIVQNGSIFVAYYLNDGQGSFASRSGFPSGGRPKHYNFIDFSRDGFDDIVISDVFEFRLSLIELDPTQEPKAPVFYPLPDRANSFAPGDFNQDGVPDLAVQIRGVTQPIQILLGQPDGGFSDGASIDAGFNSSMMKVDDMNRDGFDDIVLLSSFTQEVVVFYGGPNQSFAPPHVVFLGQGATDLELADINNDSYPDIALRSAGSGNHIVIPSMPTVYPDLIFPTLASSYYIGRTLGSRTLVDWDQDGDLDYVYNQRDFLTVAENQYTTAKGPCLPDLNGDGELNFFDVSVFLVAYYNSDPVADFNGDGQFTFFDVSAFLVAYQGGCP